MLRIGLWTLGGLLLLAGIDPVLAQDATAAAPPPAIDAGSTAWMLTSSLLVLMMSIPGLALFYAGMVRKKNVLSVLMQVFAVTALMSIVWMIAGYSLAFTTGSAYVGDLSKVMLAGVGLHEISGVIPESVFVMFQGTFFAITPALIIGAFVDRTKFGPMLIFMILWSLIVYAPIAHWVWAPSGFLYNEGVLDYAGGTVVHINAGIAGLIFCLVVGKRRGYGTEHMPPHNLVLTLIGTALLWVGWFGFNAGSAAAADPRAGMAMLTTHIAAASAAIFWMLSEWITRGKPSLLGACSGAVAGLVAITPAAGFVLPNGALFIGIAAGIVCFISATWLKNLLGYDDSLDVFGVHGVGGILGAILTGVFAVGSVGGDAARGLIDGNAGQVLIQVKGVLWTVGWCAVASFVILMVVRMIFGLRVDEEVEREGLDSTIHGEVVQ
ncbi:ammonium transporter [Arboricoccus pini]|uniref:Ammonium transporter n=1 Tax=Arboricoccus pini TaxID=1963835 RepID=A0A212QZP2_9PROT|nr:ammonium transporter [Arboricoccus pini]SNB65027.1 ammonium transporter [Arboricoccus pini]